MLGFLGSLRFHITFLFYTNSIIFCFLSLSHEIRTDSKAKVVQKKRPEFVLLTYRTYLM
jgi:hypothetical protein